MGRYFRKMGRSVSFLSKNGRGWVVFLEKWVGVGESDWEWVRVVGSGWERNSVKLLLYPCKRKRRLAIKSSHENKTILPCLDTFFYLSFKMIME